MNQAEVLETLPITAWDDGVSADLAAQALEALEAGKVLFLPQLRFEIAPAEAGFLNPEVGDDSRKNVSLDPVTGQCSATALAPGEAERLAAMMRRYAVSVTGLLHALLPSYAPALERARTSFRPAEIAGRDYSPRHDDRLLHVDAFPTRPLSGRRILRVFSNVADDGSPRQWRVGEPFADFAGKFAARAKRPMIGQAWAMQTLGLTKGRRTAYDQMMLSLHDQAKQDAAYQADAPKVDLSFPAGATWLCFTDQVLHAALSGHCALEQTFHLPVSAMAQPERSPLRVLERLSGRRLAA